MESSKGRAPSRLVIALLIGLIVVIWAINFITAKIGLRSFPPLTMASFRVCAAGLVMIPFYLGVRRLRLAAFASPEGGVRRAWARARIYLARRLEVSLFGVFWR